MQENGRSAGRTEGCGDLVGYEPALAGATDDGLAALCAESVQSSDRTGKVCADAWDEVGDG
jgi:hypothetical protein